MNLASAFFVQHRHQRQSNFSETYLEGALITFGYFYLNEHAPETYTMPLSAVQSRKGSLTPVGPTSRRKTHVPTGRPPFERIALILQGGGALGSYQAGVYQALAEANLHPDWVAGISIGAVNAALIAGNPPERRVDRLREFWEAVSVSPFGVPNFPFDD